MVFEEQINPPECTIHLHQRQAANLGRGLGLHLRRRSNACDKQKQVLLSILILTPPYSTYKCFLLPNDSVSIPDADRMRIDAMDTPGPVPHRGGTGLVLDERQLAKEVPALVVQDLLKWVGGGVGSGRISKPLRSAKAP